MLKNHDLIVFFCYYDFNKTTQMQFGWHYLEYAITKTCFFYIFIANKLFIFRFTVVGFVPIKLDSIITNVSDFLHIPREDF